MRYNATITSGSLKVPESRIVAGMLLQGTDDWRAEILEQNVLQTRSPETAKRLSRLLRARLKLMRPELAFDAGAKRILLPMASVGDVPTVPGELFAKFQTSFYSDPRDAAFKSLGVD